MTKFQLSFLHKRIKQVDIEEPQRYQSNSNSFSRSGASSLATSYQSSIFSASVLPVKIHKQRKPNISNANQIQKYKLGLFKYKLKNIPLQTLVYLIYASIIFYLIWSALKNQQSGQLAGKSDFNNIMGSSNEIQNLNIRNNFDQQYKYDNKKLLSQRIIDEHHNWLFDNTLNSHQIQYFYRLFPIQTSILVRPQIQMTANELMQLTYLQEILEADQSTIRNKDNGFYQTQFLDGLADSRVRALQSDLKNILKSIQTSSFSVDKITINKLGALFLVFQFCTMYYRERLYRKCSQLLLSFQQITRDDIQALLQQLRVKSARIYYHQRPDFFNKNKPSILNKSTIEQFAVRLSPEDQSRVRLEEAVADDHDHLEQLGVFGKVCKLVSRKGKTIQLAEDVKPKNTTSFLTYICMTILVIFFAFQSFQSTNQMANDLILKHQQQNDIQLVQKKLTQFQIQFSQMIYYAQQTVLDNDDSSYQAFLHLAANNSFANYVQDSIMFNIIYQFENKQQFLPIMQSLKDLFTDVTKTVKNENSLQSQSQPFGIYNTDTMDDLKNQLFQSVTQIEYFTKVAMQLWFYSQNLPTLQQLNCSYNAQFDNLQYGFQKVYFNDEQCQRIFLNTKLYSNNSNDLSDPKDLNNLRAKCILKSSLVPLTSYLDDIRLIINNINQLYNRTIETQFDFIIFTAHLSQKRTEVSVIFKCVIDAIIFGLCLYSFKHYSQKLFNNVRIPTRQITYVNALLQFAILAILTAVYSCNVLNQKILVNYQNQESLQISCSSCIYLNQLVLEGQQNSLKINKGQTQQQCINGLLLFCTPLVNNKLIVQQKLQAALVNNDTDDITTFSNYQDEIAKLDVSVYNYRQFQSLHRNIIVVSEQHVLGWMLIGIFLLMFCQLHLVLFNSVFGNQFIANGYTSKASFYRTLQMLGQEVQNSAEHPNFITIKQNLKTYVLFWRQVIDFAPKLLIVFTIVTFFAFQSRTITLGDRTLMSNSKYMRPLNNIIQYQFSSIQTISPGESDVQLVTQIEAFKQSLILLKHFAHRIMGDNIGQQQYGLITNQLTNQQQQNSNNLCNNVNGLAYQIEDKEQKEALLSTDFSEKYFDVIKFKNFQYQDKTITQNQLSILFEQVYSGVTDCFLIVNSASCQSLNDSMQIINLAVQNLYQQADDTGQVDKQFDRIFTVIISQYVALIVLIVVADIYGARRFLITKIQQFQQLFKSEKE